MTYRRQLRKQSGAVGKRGGIEMIKSKCKNGKCRIKTEGRPKDMADECAYIMISVAKRIKKDNTSMEDMLNAMAKYAAKIAEQLRVENSDK